MTPGLIVINQNSQHLQSISFGVNDSFDFINRGPFSNLGIFIENCAVQHGDPDHELKVGLAGEQSLVILPSPAEPVKLMPEEPKFLFLDRLSFVLSHFSCPMPPMDCSNARSER